MLEIDDFGNLINIVVFLFKKNFDTSFTYFVGIYVYFITAAQRESIIVCWPRGGVVFTKKVAKKLKKLGVNALGCQRVHKECQVRSVVHEAGSK